MLAAAAALLGAAEAFNGAAPLRAVRMTPASLVRTPAIVEMGRGDKRTTKGKRRSASFGNVRPRNGELRRSRDGPGPDTSVAAKVVDEVVAAAPAPEPVAEPVAEVAPAPEPVAEVAPAPEPEPEPVPAPAAALDAKSLAKAVKELRGKLPRADMKTCKAALEASGGDIDAAMAAIEADMSEKWAAEDEAKAVALKEGTAKLMEMRDAKAQKKFAEEEAKVAAAPEPAPEPAPAPAPEPVAEAAAPATATEPPAKVAAPTGLPTTLLTTSVMVNKAGVSAENAILLSPKVIISKAGLSLIATPPTESSAAPAAQAPEAAPELVAA